MEDGFDTLILIFPLLSLLSLPLILPENRFGTTVGSLIIIITPRQYLRRYYVKQMDV